MTRESLRAGIAIGVAAGVLTCAPHAAAQLPYPWETVEAAGFGDAGNRSIATLEALEGQLFAGTARSAGGGPAQLWTSRSGDPGSWGRVDAIQPPLAASTHAITALAATPGGPFFLGTADPAGAAVYRSADGATWGLATTPGSGWSPHRAVVVEALTVHAGALYVATRHPRGAAVWRTPLAGGRFERVLGFAGVRPITDAVTALETYRGYLYAGTHRPGGGRLWRSRDGARGTWRSVAVREAGRVRPGNVTMGSELAVFEGALHVATENRYGAEVFRTRDARRWRVVAASGIVGDQRPVVSDMTVGLGHLWLTTSPGVARVWRANTSIFGLGFGQANQDGFGSRTVRAGAPSVAVFADAVYWGGRDARRGAQLRRLTRSTVERLDTPGPGIEFPPQTLRLTADPVVAVTIRCPQSDPFGCHGELSVRTRRPYRLGGRLRRVLVGRTITDLDSGKSVTLRLRVGRAEHLLLRRLGRVAVRARHVAFDNAHDTHADFVLET